MARLMVDDVTLLRNDQVTAPVRFRGGATRTLELPRPLRAWELRQTDPAVIREIDRLLDDHTDGEVVAILNQRGVRPYEAEKFDRLVLFKLRQSHGLVDRFTRLRRRGLLTQAELAALLGVYVQTLQVWQRDGRLTAHAYNDKGGRLYEPPGDQPPMKYQWQRSQKRRFVVQAADEVQSVA